MAHINYPKAKRIKTKALIATIALTAIMAIPASAITQAECQQIQQTAHQMAECARQLGYPEDSVIIQEAQKKWWEAENSVWRGPVLTARAGTVMGAVREGNVLQPADAGCGADYAWAGLFGI